MIKRLLTIAMAALAIALGTTVVDSATAPATALGTYSLDGVGPTMYQTNRMYSTPNQPSPAGVTGTVDGINVRYSFNTANGAQPPGLSVQLCNAQRCAPITSSGQWTYAFAGDPANNVWALRFYSSASTTYTFKPTPYYGGNYAYQVNYN
ncbi:flagellar protein FlhE [Blastococcus sp. TF02-9]|uniref:flagellar protein FlhE n=1 Tax=Blastococcus sp. TF02-09 TaxID=2250576 RepID=UPI00131492FC|nr:flagellar protein FlhE [Blastococcus sp. TF02-9]